MMTGRRGYAWPDYVCDMRELTLDAEALLGGPLPQYASERVLKSATAAGVLLVLGFVTGGYGLLKLVRGEKPTDDNWFNIVFGATGILVGLGLGLYAWLRHWADRAGP